MELGVLMVAVLVVGGALALVRRGQGRTAALNAAVDAFRLGDGEEGERQFEVLSPLLKGVRDRVDAAERLTRARAFEHALELVEAARAHTEEDPRVERLRALLHGKMVRDDAVGLMRAWLERSPKDYEVRMELSRLLLRLRRLDEAVESLEVVLGRHPEDLEARSMLGRAHFFAGRLVEAEAALKAAFVVRDKRRRRVVSMYDPGTETGYDFKVAVEGQWEEEQDRLLLAQIRDGEASAAVAQVSAVEARVP